jgi:hypothetical protein
MVYSSFNTDNMHGSCMNLKYLIRKEGVVNISSCQDTEIVKQVIILLNI